MWLPWMRCCPVSARSGSTGNWPRNTPGRSKQMRNVWRRLRVSRQNSTKNLVSGILTKEEFLSYKRKYNADIELLQKAVAEWNEKLTDVLENRSERNRWINHFMQFSTMEEIDRRAVMQLIRSIRVMGKDELHIEFNYQDEYQKAVSPGGTDCRTRQRKEGGLNGKKEQETEVGSHAGAVLICCMWRSISAFLWRIIKSGAVRWKTKAGAE